MNVTRTISFILLIVLSLGIITLSQLDNHTTRKVYISVSQTLHIDLQAFNIKIVQISDRGHIVAGFVLCGFALLVIRRWWVIPLTLLFFLGIEAGQLFAVDRQASWVDVLRSWSGVFVAWGLVVIFRAVLGRGKWEEGRRKKGTYQKTKSYLHG